MRIKKSTNTFRFRKAKGEDAPAIWFRLHGRDVKVYPLALYDALWNELIDDFICKGVKATISMAFFSIIHMVIIKLNIKAPRSLNPPHIH